MVSKNKKKMIFLKNLRYDYYFLLKNCNYILGNSSSGIVEAATFSTPVVNLGIRQTGKLIPKNVISCKFNSSSILRAIKKINNKDFKKKIDNIKNPWRWKFWKKNRKIFKKI